MIIIDHEDSQFIVYTQAGSTTPITTGRHRVFFAIQMEGTMLVDEVGWRIPSGDNEFQTYSEIIAYLSRFQIQYQLQNGALIISEQIREQQDLYELARTRGQEVKDLIEIEEFDCPEFVRVLKDHQSLSAHHLLQARNAANFSVPGSGKTSVVLAVYSNLRTRGEVDGLLVIGPPSCFMAWEDEYEKCFGHRGSVIRIAGIPPEDRVSIYRNHGQYEIFLTTYQTAYRDVEYIIRLCRDRELIVILDESHYIKRMEGGRYSEAVLRIAPNSTRRVILTGTPMPNNTRDLWTQFTFLWPNEEILGASRHFASRENDIEGIQEDISPFFIRIRKQDLNLPPPTFHFISFQLNPLQSRIYRALAVNTLAELDLLQGERDEIRRWRRAKMIRLLQAASNPTLLNKHAEEFRTPPLDTEDTTLVDWIQRYPEYEIPIKIHETMSMARDLTSAGRKVLIWTWFVHNIEMLRQELSDLEPLLIHGGIPRDDNIDQEFNREIIIRDFLSSDDHNILIANPAACGESISLHSSCHDAIYLDRTFNCGQYLQSLDRIHRIGLAQDQETNYYIMIAENTIDGDVRTRLVEKERRMLELIEEDLPLLTMDVVTEDVSDDEIDEDFTQVIETLRLFIERDD